MTGLPYFSVLVPTYNRKQRLQDCLRKIIAQSIADFEVIVIDDGGTDDTEKMVRDLGDSRIHYFRQKNHGPLVARAVAADHAVGEWLCFCDSDDQWEADYLEAIANVDAETNIDVVFTDYFVEGEKNPRISGLSGKGFFDGYVEKTLQNRSYQLKDNFLSKLLHIQPIMISAFAVRRQFYERLGGIDKSLHVVGSEDSHLTLRAIGLGKTIYIDRPYVTLGRGGDNLSENFLRNLEGGLEIMEKIKRERQVPLRFQECLAQSINRQRFEIAKQYYWQRNLQQSLEALKEGGIKRPRAERTALLLKIVFRWIIGSVTGKV